MAVQATFTERKEAAKTERLLNAPFWILPSGRVIAWRDIQFVGPDPRNSRVLWVAVRSDVIDESECAGYEIENAHDIAALQSALLRVGEPIESATLKGDDPDGDGPG